MRKSLNNVKGIRMCCPFFSPVRTILLKILITSTRTVFVRAFVAFLIAGLLDNCFVWLRVALWHVPLNNWLLHRQLKMFSTRSSDCVKSPDSINFTGDESIYTSWHSLKCSYCVWREEVTKRGRSNHWQTDYIWQQKTRGMNSPLLFVNAAVKSSSTN